MSRFIPIRKEAIRVLRDISERLTANQKGGNVAKIVGSSVGIAGTVVAVGSIPLTGGLSLVALGIGAALGVGGAATGIGAEIKTRFTEKDLLEKAKKILEEDKLEAERLAVSLEKIKTELDEIVRTGMRVSVGTGAGIAAVLARIAPRIVTICPRTGVAVVGGLTAAGKVIKGAGVALGVLFIPLEIWNIVSNASEIKQGSKAAEAITDVIVQLEADLQELQLFNQ